MRNSTYALTALRRTIAVITLLVLTLAGVVSGRSGLAETGRNKGLSDKIANVLRSPQVSNEINSRADAPISIIDSSSLEISRKVYQQLTGSKTLSPRAVSYPKVTLLNTSDAAVTQVLLILSNKTTGIRTRLKISNINIGPQDTYVVDSEKWMIPALMGAQKTDNQGQQRVISRKEVLRYDSDRVWMIGKATDLSIAVAMVEQANGARWDILSRNKVSATQGNGLQLRPVAYNPATAQGCWCEGTVICWDDGSYICWGSCYGCSIEDCAICAIIGCTITCILILE